MLFRLGVVAACLGAWCGGPTPTLAFLSGPSSSSGGQACHLDVRRRTTALGAASAVSGRSAELSKGPVIICPAQFGISDDYEEMVDELARRGHPAIPLALSRLDWLKITRSLLTSDYWQGTLKPKDALGFYFSAIEEALGKAKQDYPDYKVHLVAHSIGGWIARAYLGEIIDPEERRTRVASLTTLGSPHLPPTGEGIWARVDQTRGTGMLTYITDNFPGTFHATEGIKYVTVCGTSTTGKIGPGIEELVSFVSYLPLCGRGDVIGDGIVPEEVALLEGSVQVVVPGVKHAGFIPTPGPSIRLPKSFTWYGSREIVDQWLKYLPERATVPASARR